MRPAQVPARAGNHKVEGAITHPGAPAGAGLSLLWCQAQQGKLLPLHLIRKLWGLVIFFPIRYC